MTIHITCVAREIYEDALAENERLRALANTAFGEGQMSGLSAPVQQIKDLRAEIERLKQGREMTTDQSIPNLLQGIAPTVGSTWEWMPHKPDIRQRVTVTRVYWNGEEVWVEAAGPDGKSWPNELSRWIEATVFISPAPEET